MNHCIPILIALFLIALPLAGAWMTGQPISQYTEFPPLTRYVEHAGFSLPAFIIFSLGALALFVPMLWTLRRAWKARPATPPSARFPAWGWVGAAWTAAAWVLAWTRFEWAAPLQPYTFTPLWLGYIVIVNALVYRRNGTCMMTRQPRYLLLLFPVSAAFWWYFEYLNRFVQNWYYVGVTDMTPTQYFWMATLPFSTVLPAVLGTYEWLDASLGPLPGAAARPDPFAGGVRPKVLAVLLLAASALGLTFLAARPDILFPLLWLSPLFILSALRLLGGRPPLDVAPGNSLPRRVALLAAAALICGFFWEMWNEYSLARWIYAVPYVNRFRLFEMPLLGYTGYLPFGLECALVGDAVRRRFARRGPEVRGPEVRARAEVRRGPGTQRGPGTEVRGPEVRGRAEVRDRAWFGKGNRSMDGIRTVGKHDDLARKPDDPFNQESPVYEQTITFPASDKKPALCSYAMEGEPSARFNQADPPPDKQSVLVPS